MKLNEEHKKKRTQNWGELICELDCSRLKQQNCNENRNLIFLEGRGEVQVAFVFAAVVSV